MVLLSFFVFMYIVVYECNMVILLRLCIFLQISFVCSLKSDNFILMLDAKKPVLIMPKLFCDFRSLQNGRRDEYYVKLKEWNNSRKMLKL